MIAETVVMPGANGDMINAYFARPLGAGPFPALALAHHMPGWDEWYRETAFKFANRGYVTLMPNLYFRSGHGTPEDVAAKVRADGGVPDDQAVGDLAGAMKYLRASWSKRFSPCWIERRRRAASKAGRQTYEQGGTDNADQNHRRTGGKAR